MVLVKWLPRAVGDWMQAKGPRWLLQQTARSATAATLVVSVAAQSNTASAWLFGCAIVLMTIDALCLHTGSHVAGEAARREVYEVAARMEAEQGYVLHHKHVVGDMEFMTATHQGLGAAMLFQAIQLIVVFPVAFAHSSSSVATFALIFARELVLRFGPFSVPPHAG